MNLPNASIPAYPAPGAEARRTPLNVLFGVPDDGEGLVRVAPDGSKLLPAEQGRRDFTLRGSANIAPFLSRARFAMKPYYLQGGTRIQLNLGPGAILNHIADPDICSRALALVADVAGRIKRPCFNHPAAVALTSRDGVAQRLAGIPQLTVPRTIRVHQTSPADVRLAAKKADLCYPILVRVVGSHGGEDRVRIERPDDMDEITQLTHEGRPLYLTEFRDFASPDGLYRKFRVIVIGGDIFLRQCVIGEHWSLHGRSRVAGLDQEEADMFGSFDSGLAPEIRPVFDQMTRRLDLDYFGVDCSIDSDRQVLLFEANACMKVLKNYKVSPNRFDAPIARIKEALENRLASPEKWRHASLA